MGFAPGESCRRSASTCAMSRRYLSRHPGAGWAMHRIAAGSKAGTCYFATLPRITQARAVKEIEPSSFIGRRSRTRSRRRALASSSSDMA